jgi:poly(beta-D-mannuronate) C5 epimerase
MRTGQGPTERGQPRVWAKRLGGAAALLCALYLTPLHAAGLADVQALARAVRDQVLAAEASAALGERGDAYAQALRAFDELARNAAATEAAEAETMAETVAYAKELLNELAAGGITRDMLAYARVAALAAAVAHDRKDPDDARTAAYLAAQEIKEAGLRASALLTIAGSYEATAAARAMRFVNFALDGLATLTDPHERSVAVRDVIETALRLGPLGLAVAEDTIAALREAPLRAGMRQRRALALIEGGQTPQELRAALALPDPAGRVQALAEAGAAALRADDLDLALLATEALSLDAEQQRRRNLQAIHSAALEKRRFELATAAAFGIAGVGEQSDWLLDQVRAQLAAGYPDQARAVTDLILEPLAASEAFAQIGKALARKGYRNQAEGAFQAALTALDQADRDASGLAKQTGDVLKTLADSGFAAAAESALARLPDPAERARPLAALIKHYAEAGNLERAEQLFAEIASGEHRSRAAGALAKALADGNRLREARRYAAAAVTPEDRGRAWYGIARSLAGAGEDPAPALAEIEEPHWRGDALAQVGRILAKRGERAAAEDYFRQALAIARTLPEKERARLLHRVLEARAAAGDSAQARALLAELPAGRERLEAVLILVAADVEAGRFEAALPLLDALDDPDKRDEAAGRIALGLAEHGKLREALTLARGIGDDQQRVRALRRIAEREAIRNDVFGLLPGNRDNNTGTDAVRPAGVAAAARGSAVELSAQIALRPLASESLGRLLPALPPLDAQAATVRGRVPAIAPGEAHEALMIYNEYSRKFFQNTEGEGGGRRLAQRQGVVSPRYIYLEDGVFNFAAISRDLRGSTAEDAVSRDGDIVTVRLPILIGPNATLVISGNELAELRLSASQGAFIVNSGRLHVVDARVVGYDEKRRSVAWSTYEQRYTFRPFILSWSSSDTQLANSSFVALGYKSTKAFGIALSSGPTEIVKGSQEAQRPTGVLIDNSFDNVYYGFYSYEADHVQLVGNEYRNNVLYGLDPHDRSRYLIIAYNTAYDTQKKHGAIISREVDHNVIVGNVSFANAGSGFMVDRDSVATLLYANTAFDNQQDGLSLFESACSLVAANHFFDNRRGGVKIRNSWDVGLFRNRIAGNQGAALEGYITRLEDAPGGAQRDYALDPYTPLTTFTAVDNLILANAAGIVGKGATAMTLVGNQFVDQAPRLFGGDLRPHTLDLLPFSHLARGGALVMSACRPPAPPVSCPLRAAGWFIGDGQDELFATADNAPACERVPGTLEAQALLSAMDARETQVE